MSDEDNETLKRGAEAGWALGLALKEVYPDPDRNKIAIKAAIAALTLLEGLNER